MYFTSQIVRGTISIAQEIVRGTIAGVVFLMTTNYRLCILLQKNNYQKPFRGRNA